MSWRRLEDIFARCLEDVFKMSWRRLENVLKPSWQDVFKTYDQGEYIGLDQDVEDVSEDV